MINYLLYKRNRFPPRCKVIKLLPTYLQLTFNPYNTDNDLHKNTNNTPHSTTINVGTLVQFLTQL